LRLQSIKASKFNVWSGIVRVSLLFLCLIGLSGCLWGQGEYSLNGQATRAMGKSVTLTVYDGDSSCHRVSKRIKDGEFSFTGYINKPCVAELTFSGGRGLYLYLEPSEMNVDVNGEDLEHSPVTGSRTNSQYRYALENNTSGKALAEFIKNNKTSPVAAFLLFRQMRNMEVSELDKLYGNLDSNEARCYHYYAVGRYISEVEALSVGKKLPDFEFVESGRAVRLSECLRNDTATVVFFGATWCDICKRDTATARLLCGDSVTFINIDIDDDRRGWDAPYITKLDITHLPYIILLDGKGRIVARDVRVWELERMFKH